MASVLLDMVDDGTEIRISWGFERPVEKYASLAQNLSFLGFGGSSKDIKALQGSYLNPHYLKNKVKVSFLPDRVLFIVDNKVISTLLAIAMNEDGFKQFQEQNQDYFANYFAKQAKLGLARMNGQVPPPSNIKIEKKAASNNISQIFERVDIHPAIYFMALTKKYTIEWMNFDIDVLISIIEKDFNLENGIEDTALNKILSIQTCNTSQIPYQSLHAFEKIIRCFNNKPVNFLEREINDMGMVDIAFGIDIMDRVTPYDDIYDNFSNEVFGHIIQILANSDVRFFLPSAITKSEKEPEFYDKLNGGLLEAINRSDIDRIEDETIEAQALKNNQRIYEVSLGMVGPVRKQIEKNKDMDADSFISMLLKKMNIPAQPVGDAIKTQILKNLRLDNVLKARENLLNEQTKFFNLE
jgi:hypothetical protein